MQPRTLEQVVSSLGSVYDPQVQAVQAQKALLPQQLQNDESALQGQQNQAYDNILQGARRRGIGVAFGGIPLGEQAQYNSNVYMPAAANLRSSYAQRGQGLEDAILGINRDRATQGQSIFENERNFYEQQRQFNEAQAASARAASSAGYSPSFGGASPTTASPSAQTYIGNNDLRGNLLYKAQKEGNQDAAIAIKYVGNDGRYNLNPYLTNPTILAALNRLGATNVWKPTNNSPQPTQSTSNTNQYGGSTSGVKKLGF